MENPVIFIIIGVKQKYRGVEHGQDGIIDEGFFSFCRPHFVDRDMVDWIRRRSLGTVSSCLVFSGLCGDRYLPGHDFL